MSEELPLVEGDQAIPYPDDDAMDPLVIRDENGELLFAIRKDGTATMPDPEKAPLAAGYFWREVLGLADLLGIKVVTA